MDSYGDGGDGTYYTMYHISTTSQSEHTTKQRTMLFNCRQTLCALEDPSSYLI